MLAWGGCINWPKVPRVLITNFFLTENFSSITTQQDLVFPTVKDEINGIRISKNLPPIDNPRDLYHATRVCLADPIALIENNISFPLSDEYRASGACYWEMKGQLQHELSALSDILLISLGSTGLTGIDQALIQAIKQKSNAKTTVLVGNLAENTSIANGVDFAVKRTPLDRIYSKTRLAITQGGAGSTYQALSHGVPVIIYPSHRNHQIMGKVIEKAGLGVSINSNEDIQKLDLFDLEKSCEAAYKYKVDMKIEDSVNSIVDSIVELI